MIGFPLDSHVIFDRDGNPSFDRGITSAPLRNLIKSIMTDGVLPDASRLFDDITSDSFKVVPYEGMSIKIKKGFGICNGCMKFMETETVLTADNSTSSDRIDTVVLRLNNNDDVRECEFYILKGTPATNPVRPAIIRNASIYDIAIADILISSNSEQITAAKITDTRLDSDRCGLITAIAEFDTANIYDQIIADLAEFKTHEEADFASWYAAQTSDFSAWYATQTAAFNAWFASIQDVLDEDTAAHLLNLINRTRDGILQNTQNKTTTYSGNTVTDRWADGHYCITSYNGNIVTEQMYDGNDVLMWTKTTTYNGNTVQEVIS